MTQNSEKPKPTAQICKRSATEYAVALTDKGVKIDFTAFCPIPERSGTGNFWQVYISSVKSAKHWDDLQEFLESHEMMSILRYDLQDWCRENLEVDLEEYEGHGMDQAIRNLISF